MKEFSQAVVQTKSKYELIREGVMRRGRRRAMLRFDDASHDRCARMSKQSMREEAERLIRETMQRKPIVVKQGNTRIETTCGKCGAPNRLSAAKGAGRVKFACKQCGHKQETL
jgi:hypothetical protein